MDRHTCRIVVIRALYAIDFNKYENIDEEKLEELISYAIDPLAECEFPINWDNLECTEENLKFIKDTINYILYNNEKIDDLISHSLVNYTIDRLSYVDRAIIRLAVAEFIKAELAKNIIINEALELTKEYSNLDDGLQVKFNNRLLENISQGFKNE